MTVRRASVFSACVAIQLAFAPYAHAQSVMSLSAVIDAVLAANPEVAGARAAVLEAEARMTQARSGYFPRIDFTQSWQHGNQPVFVFGALLAQRQFAEADFALQQLNHPEAITNARSAFSLEYALFDAGRTRAAARMASLETSVARSAERQARNDLVLVTTRTYGRVLMADAAALAAGSAVAASEQDARVAEARRDAGTASEADVLAIRTHLADMRARSIDAAAEQRIARAELNRLMNRPLDADIVLTLPTPGENALRPPGEPPASAGDQRPELEQAALRVDLAEAARTRARDAVLPEIAVQGGYEWNDGARGGPASAWVTGAAVRLNLFSGGAAMARMKEAGHAAERARAEQQRAIAEIQMELLTAVEQLAAARAREHVGRAAVAQSRESQRIIRDRFEAGLASTSDVIRAATAVLDADAQRVRAVIDVMVGEAAARRAKGETYP